MVSVKTRLIFWGTAIIISVSTVLSYMAYTFQNANGNQHFFIPRAEVEINNSKTIDDIVEPVNEPEKPSEIIPQEEYVRQIKVAQQKVNNICFYLNVEKRNIDDYEALDVLLFHLKNFYRVEINNPFEYNEKIKAFAQDAVKGVDPNDEEAVLKALYSNIAKDLEPHQKIEPNVIYLGPVGWDAKKTFKYYKKHGKFPRDCNTMDYFFGACARSLGYIVYEAEVIRYNNNEIVERTIGGVTYKHVCCVVNINKEYKQIDIVSNSPENLLYGFGIEHKEIQIKTPFDSIEIQLNESQNYQNTKEALKFVEDINKQ